MVKLQRGLPNTFYLSLVTVNPASDVPLYRQIYQGLRDGIVNGRLTANTKLPSTRDLSTIWGVSRNTLRNAFDQLIAEGYLEAIVGHGTFVAAQQTQTRHTPAALPIERPRPISNIGQLLEPFGRSLQQPSPPASAFAIGAPGLDLFPYKVWNRIINRCLQRSQQMSTPINGLLKLRQAIASYLNSARGLHCSPEQIDIVPGAVSGILIATLALLNPNDEVWMEEPGYINVSGLIQYRGAKLIPVPVDQAGLDVQAGIERAPDARLAYVTPSHQYPLGVTMSLARRHQLLTWAASSNAWIFEDDYDSVFRYNDSPTTALQGLDSQQRVLYFGTFSKVMLPGLRLGYVVMPPDLVDVYTGVKLPMSLSSTTIIQEAIAEFMLEGHFVRHIRKMNKLYQARRDALVTAVERHLAGVLSLGTVSCGMHTIGFLADEFDEATVVTKAREIGMAFAPLSQAYFAEPKRKGLFIGFTNVPAEAIDGYFASLAAAIL
ncbi:MAG: GntR family transcriptional regulator [Ardenticatenaceae bacterium]|nr:MAG: GntR family transcriptional regulator [Ardenticatenaceae bacterium]